MKFIKLGSFLLVWAFCVIAAFAQQNVTRHQVSKGETLYSLAKKHGVTVDDLVAANPRLREEALKAGMEISIPTVAVAPRDRPGWTAVSCTRWRERKRRGLLRRNTA